MRLSSRLARAFATSLGLAVGLGAAAPSFAAPGRALTASHDSLATGRLALTLAASAHARGDAAGVVAHLEGVDWAAGPMFDGADRAAFLLTQAYRRTGDRARATELAIEVSRWKLATVWTRWIAAQHALEGGSPAGGAVASTGSAQADALAAAWLLHEGRPGEALLLLRATPDASALNAHLQALALEATGADAEGAWLRAATTDTASRLGRDLAAAARLRLASRAIARNDDPRPHLAAVPVGTRLAARAAHVAGLVALERGEGAAGDSLLRLALADTTYESRREVAMALAGRSLDRGRWAEAHSVYGLVEGERSSRADALRARLAANDTEAFWREWRAVPAGDALPVDAAGFEALAASLAASAAALANDSTSEPPAWNGLAPTGVRTLAAAPTRDEQTRVAAAARDAAQARADAGRARRDAERERASLADRRRYLGAGADRARTAADVLAREAARLDSLRAALDATHAKLAAVRDAAIRRVAERTDRVLAEVDGHDLWNGAMRFYHVDGPARVVPERVAPGSPTSPSLLAEEAALARTIRRSAEELAARAPELIARSYEKAWGPKLLDRALAQRDDAHALLAWARALGVSVDSSIAAARTSAELVRAEALAAARVRRADSLAAASDVLRAAVAKAAGERALASLEAEREGVDYGLAAAAYGLGVRLERQAVADTAHDDDAVLDDPETVRWRAEAVRRHEAFLAAHPNSSARGETRFRLADLAMVTGRQQFREAMARWTRGESRTLPVLDHAPALALYRRILAEDPDFAHRDAVLYNAGMILADAGSDEAATMFGRLVEEFPASPYVQESWLRMGDLAFNDKRYADCVPLYAKAIAGPDANLQAIALYKTGWAEFNREKFTDAAEAFAGVLDLYASDKRAAIHADIEDEAQAYLVNALGNSGGAEAHQRFFATRPARPYERRTLLALGQHFRRYGQFADAVRVDELVIANHPLERDALVSAQRLIETHLRANHGEQAMKARHELAPRFADGSDWARAQASDSLRAAGRAFALGAWEALASHHHLEARRTGAAASWTRALEYYETLLKHEPPDSTEQAMHLAAGEAATQLERPQVALEHYRDAARRGPDSLVALALVQRVAVSDAWYERTRARGARGATGLGTDSLAKAVIREGDALLDRFPAHARSADVTWRQGQLALAHGWPERAVKDFARMVERHPADARTPLAASLRARAEYDRGDYESAGQAYEEALAVARRAGRDSLVRTAEAALPVCAYKHAESVVAKDSTDAGRYAPLFERVAARWPQYEHAHLAQYRAGLAYARAGKPRESIAAMQTLLRVFPRSEYVRDARVHVATTAEAAGRKDEAAAAWGEFAAKHPADSSAADAWLKSADLWAEAGQPARADSLRLSWLRRYPGDVEGAMEILEGFAKRELAALGPQTPISTLLPAAAPKKRAAAPPSRLAEYLARGAKRPDLVSKPLLAQVRFLQAEESRTAYSAVKLTLPLAPAIAAKQKAMNATVALYRQTVDAGVPEWSHAATCRIGEVLVEFGDALVRSEKPADLKGDDLAAYENVLIERAAVFQERAENVWTELLRQKSAAKADDEWLRRARAGLWQRLAGRFYFRPEAEFPLVEAREPERVKVDRADDEDSTDATRGGSKDRRAARREDRQP